MSDIWKAVSLLNLPHFPVFVPVTTPEEDTFNREEDAKIEKLLADLKGEKQHE